MTRGDEAKAVIALDANGELVDLEALRAFDRALGAQRRGKISIPLYERIATTSLDEPLLVVAWIVSPSVDDLRGELAAKIEAIKINAMAGDITHEQMDALNKQHAQDVASRIGALTANAASRFVNAGIEVVGRDSQAPIVFVRGRVDQLTPLLDDETVESLDDANGRYVERLNVAHTEVRADQAWAQVGGVTGVGAKVAVVESGRICTTNPNMTVSATFNPFLATGAHVTGVASCIASKHLSHKGVAPGATLYSANGADYIANPSSIELAMPGTVAAIGWSILQGAHIMNLSYGAGAPGSTLTSFDRYLDWIARSNAKTIVIACGNSGNFAGDPGAGYNQIAVGAFDDKAGSAWAGETMANFSSWKNPTTGVETPQVAAPGVNINMLTCGTGVGYLQSGTSFAAPLVAGTAALCVSKKAELASWPEAIRAIVMATAWHNIEGLADLSSKDGAGGIDSLAAFKVAKRGKGPGFQYGTLTFGSFNGSGFYTAQTASASAGQTVRVCLSFDSTTSGLPLYATDSLLCDLDLYVYGPGNTVVASSTSAVQPFEIVQFTAPSTGTYTVKIKRYSFTGASEYFGTAFTTSSDK